MRLIIIVVGAAVSAVVALSTQLAFPPSNDWRTALYGLLGILVTLVLADTADVVQQKIQGVQIEIRDFLLKAMNSRRQRTSTMINLCRDATNEFRAVTFFPVVGVQDDPENAPADYLRAIEERLEDKARITLVSMSCTEAKEYCEADEEKFGDPDVWEWVEERLTGLANRFTEQLEIITVPSGTITVNVCHNDSTALMYHVALKDEEDDGAGFKSSDTRVVAVAKGGVKRYMKGDDLP